MGSFEDPSVQFLVNDIFLQGVRLILLTNTHSSLRSLTEFTDSSEDMFNLLPSAGLSAELLDLPPSR